MQLLLAAGRSSGPNSKDTSTKQSAAKARPASEDTTPGAVFVVAILPVVTIFPTPKLPRICSTKSPALCSRSAISFIRKVRTSNLPTVMDQPGAGPQPV
jgi:hypothetical protein